MECLFPNSNNHEKTEVALAPSVRRTRAWPYMFDASHAVICEELINPDHHAMLMRNSKGEHG